MNIKQSWQVGAFVVAGIGFFITSLFLLGGGQILQKHKYFKIHFEHVQGLNPGAVVSLAGLNIGNVQGFSFSESGAFVEVAVKVEHEQAQRITASSKADLRTQGALGDKYIYITPGLPGESPLEEGSLIAVLTTKDLLAVIAERGGEAERVFDILENVNEITKSINANQRLEKILENLLAASQDFKVASAQLSQVASNPKINQSVNRLDLILAKIEKGEGTLGALINDPTLHDSLKAFLGSGKGKEPLKNVLRDSIREVKPK